MQDKKYSRYHDIVLGLVDEQDVSIAELARMLGESKQSAHQRINITPDYKTSTLEEVLGALGYKLEIKYVGYRKVCSEYLDGVLESHVPVGIFFTDSYIGQSSEFSCVVVDNTDGKARLIGFPDEGMMYEFLDKIAATEQ